MKLFFLFFVLFSSFNAIAESSYLIGVVKPASIVNISMPVDGVIKEIKLKEGDVVAKNEVVVMLDDTLQSLELQRKKLIFEDESGLDSARIKLEQVEALVSRREQLAKRSRSVSESDLNRVRIQLSNAKGEYQSLLNSKRREEVEYKISEKVLDYYSLKSPVSGVINFVKPKIGEWVKVGDPIVTIVDISKCYVELNLDIETSIQLKNMNFVQLMVSMPTENIRKVGKVIFISPIADQSSGLVRAKVEIDNADGDIVPGITASLVIEDLEEL